MDAENMPAIQGKTSGELIPISSRDATLQIENPCDYQGRRRDCHRVNIVTNPSNVDQNFRGD